MDGATSLQTPKNRQPLIRRIGKCHCGYPVFFRNYLCLHCGRTLGYEPEQAVVLSLELFASGDGTWQVAGEASLQPPPPRAHLAVPHDCRALRDPWLELASAGQFDGQGDHHTPPAYVEKAFRKYLECGIFAHGFARVRCGD